MNRKTCCSTLALAAVAAVVGAGIWLNANAGQADRPEGEVEAERPKGEGEGPPERRNSEGEVKREGEKPQDIVAPGMTLEVRSALLLPTPKRTLELLSEVTTADGSGVLRAIKGHAQLASNHSDEALALFLSLGDKDIQGWVSWTRALAKRRPDNAVAHYLHGDALARSRRFEQALVSLQQALKLRPDFHLALNARGVVNHALGNSSDARADFHASARARPDFADAHASLGTLNVLRSATKRDRDPFAKALALDRDAALYLNGQACDLYGKQHLDKAVATLERIPSRSPVGFLVGHNLEAIKLAGLTHRLQHADEVGMTLAEQKALQQEKQQTQKVVEKGQPMAYFSSSRTRWWIALGLGGYLVLGSLLGIEDWPDPETLPKRPEIVQIEEEKRPKGQGGKAKPGGKGKAKGGKAKPKKRKRKGGKAKPGGNEGGKGKPKKGKKKRKRKRKGGEEKPKGAGKPGTKGTKNPQVNPTIVFPPVPWPGPRGPDLPPRPPWLPPHAPWPPDIGDPELEGWRRGLMTSVAPAVSMPPTSTVVHADQQVGGVETRSQKLVRRNRGRWRVAHWYGLAYEVVPPHVARSSEVSP